MRGRQSEPPDNFGALQTMRRLLALFLPPYMRGESGFEPNTPMRDSSDDECNARLPVPWPRSLQKHWQETSLQRHLAMMCNGFKSKCHLLLTMLLQGHHSHCRTLTDLPHHTVPPLLFGSCRNRCTELASRKRRIPKRPLLRNFVYKQTHFAMRRPGADHPSCGSGRGS